MPNIARSLHPEWTLISDQDFSDAVRSLNSSQRLATFWGLSNRQLNYYAYHAPEAKAYRTFTIRRRNGRSRTIRAPNRSLKYIQRIIYETLHRMYRPNIAVHGFVPNRSIITNATKHLGQQFVLNLDLRDFFRSITRARVIGRLKAAPYRLQSPVAALIGFLATDSEGKLPLGSPCSPVIANIVAAQLDSDIIELCRSLSCTYTRYADDITISTDQNKFPTNIARYPSAQVTVQVVIGDQLLDIIEDNGFQINHSKSRLQNYWTRQLCTGLVVNGESLSLPGPYKRRLRALIHNWQRFGWEIAAKRMHENEGRRLFRSRERFADHVLGRINYVRLIRGEDNPVAKRMLLIVQAIPPGQ